MAYALRSKKGEMKAKLSDHAAMTLINQGKGFGRDAKFERNGKLVLVRVFEFDQDSVLQVNDELQLFFWSGDILVPEH